jgi:hypothetical protein
MNPNDVFALCTTAGEGGTPPVPHNDNWGVASSWETPAEALQTIRRWKREIQRELVRDPQLWACPEHRLTRYIRYEMEKCALWHYYGVR